MMFSVTSVKYISVMAHIRLNGMLHATINAVSYTHLDVYKRQVKRKTGLGLSAYLRPRLFEPLGFGDVAWAVSYTHLDVYKRQVFCSFSSTVWRISSRRLPLSACMAAMRVSIEMCIRDRSWANERYR